MATIESSIEGALFARAALLVAVGGPLAGLPVARPNVAFTKPAGAYLRVTHVPNRSRRLFIGSTDPHQRMGLLQIDYFAPKNSGASAATEQAGKIAAHFPTDLDLSGVCVTKAPDVGPALADDTHWQVPVTIEYDAFA